MDTSVSFLVSSLIISIIMGITYFIRKKVNTNETRVYSYLMIISILGLIISIPLFYVIKDYQSFNIFTFLLPRLYLLYIMIYVFTMTCYFKLVSSKVNTKYFFGDVQMLFSIFLFCNLIVVMILPMEYHNSNGGVYINGLSIYYTYFISTLLCIYMLFLLLKNIKMLRNKKIIPVISLIVIGVIAAVFQFNSPRIRIITYAFSLIVQIMFFTIENPDAQLLEQVKEAKEEAEKANKTKSDFLSIISHEIRTPLNTIVNFSEELKRESLSKNQSEEIEDIYQSSLSILDTINSIIDINKLENNSLEIEEDNYQFSKVYNDLVLLGKEKLKNNKKVKFQSSISSDMPDYLYGDPLRIKQIVLNLLTNAIKYTTDGNIELSVACINKDSISRIAITVRDTGIGIKKRDLDKIFDDSNPGLSISKKLVEMMNGQIIVQSTYKKGTQIKVVLDQKIVSEAELSGIKVRKKIENQIRSDLSSKQVLIVDDNKMNLKVAKRLLENFKVFATTATSGSECIELAKEEHFDLILLDDMMPKLSGKETLEQLKTIPNFNTPVVALTANAISGVKEEYLEFGFEDYLAKPIEKDELNRVIKKFLDK